MSRFKEMVTKGRQMGANFLHLGFVQACNALVQILLFPFIIRMTGVEAFGTVVVANSFAALMGLVVNFGTSISGIQRVAVAGDHKKLLSACYSQTLVLRSIFLLVPVVALPVVRAAAPLYFTYILYSLPLVIAEVINPLYFFNGKEKLLPFNLANLLGKSVSAILILLFIKGTSDAVWVNFILGMPTLLLFALLNVYLFHHWQLSWEKVKRFHLQQLLLTNLPLAGNNLAVQLQQSFFLFVLSAINQPIMLAAYAIADKVLWGFRLVLIAFTGAVLPKAVQLGTIHPQHARQRKQQINLVFAFLFSGVAVILYSQAGLVVQLFAGNPMPLAETYVRAIAFVPLLAALNAMNVVELVVTGQFTQIFWIAMILTAVALTASLLIIGTRQTNAIAFYPLLIEGVALLLYLYFLNRRKTEVQLA